MTRLNKWLLVSTNNDPTIGKLIADAMRKVSKDGVITIEEAKVLILPSVW